MNFKRECPIQKLAKQPLALVLIQIKFTPIENIEKDYLSQIQDFLRKNDYPLINKTQSLSVVMEKESYNSEENPQWIFSSADSFSNIILDKNQFVFQLSNYETFESFFAKFDKLFTEIMNITEHDKSGYIQRLGLRYVDQIIPIDENDTIDSYFQDTMRIEQPKRFNNKNKCCTTGIYGNVELCEKEDIGNVAIRILQGLKDFSLPPDLENNAPKLVREIDKEKNIGLIDLDCSFEPEKLEKYDFNRIGKLLYKMHDILNDTFFNDVVSKEGVKKWS